MSNTISLNSESNQNGINRDDKFNLPSIISFKSYMQMAVFLVFSLIFAVLGSLAFAIIFFIIGVVGFTVLYLWDNMKGLDMDVSFQIEVNQSELERELYEVAA
ncbi:hypothetical protein [Maribacter sp. Asnod1-A12]|uniref:hypothetical protein n=1 Tax=Maribacter sp. Asnod1-A12 TaxID=3160576 RepID=UPI00386737B7